MPEPLPTALWAAWSSALVEKFKLDISKEESQQLVVKYDLKGNGKFAYCDFIQSCVLLLKAKETSLMRRMRIQNADKMVGVPSWRPWCPEPGTRWTWARRIPGGGGGGAGGAAGQSLAPPCHQPGLT